MKTCPVCSKEMQQEIISNIAIYACKQTSHSYEEHHWFKLYKIKECTVNIYTYNICLTTYNKSKDHKSKDYTIKWYEIPNFKLNPSHTSLEAIKSTINKLLIFS